MPDLYIISGSNGAGKSTIGHHYIPSHILSESTIFDGDKLYMKKHTELWKSGMRVNKEIKEIANSHVGQTFHQLVEDAIKNNKHFAYEGHFTEADSWNVPRLFKSKAYTINLIFFGLTDTKESELRVYYLILY